MKINETIKEVLSDYNITYKEGIPYLLALFYEYEPAYFPDILKKKMLTTNIFTKDSKGKIDWKISLFEGILEEYSWVKDYVAVFKKNGQPGIPSSVAESTRRFKTFFAQYPQYTVEDVKAAVNLYINAQKGSFISFPHYFINKDGHSLLLDWIETYKEEKEVAKGRESKTKTMQ